MNEREKRERKERGKREGKREEKCDICSHSRRTRN